MRHWTSLAAGLLFPLLCRGADGPTVTGTVGAPNGTLASIGTATRLADFFVRRAHAHLPGLQAVSGASVQLIEIDSRGAQVGEALASGSTNSSGVYTLTAPAGFAPAARFIVRAAGSGGERMDAFVTAPRVNIDPATDATCRLVLASGANIKAVRIADVMEVLPLVQHLAWDVEPARTGAALSAALRRAATDDEDIHNIVSSLGGTGEVNGTVTDTARKPLARITVVVRDADKGATRAIGHTDGRGRYSVKVAPGAYIVNAVNETAVSTAASDLAARKTAVAAAPVTRNFRLGAGGRIGGTVTGAGGSRLTGVRIQLRDARNGEAMVEVRTQDDGGYRLNVAPGSYVLVAENTTLQPYASSLSGTRLDVKPGDDQRGDLTLRAGHMIRGVAAPGIAVRVEHKEQVAVLRANRAGEYRLWVRP